MIMDRIIGACFAVGMLWALSGLVLSARAHARCQDMGWTGGGASWNLQSWCSTTRLTAPLRQTLDEAERNR